jgi:hypothetical protein
MESKLEVDTTPLAKHVARFAENGFFSPSTVGDGLKKIHADKAGAKGYAIAVFNASHSGNVVCPFGHTEFKSHETKGYAKYLHLGTTRIWNSDGTFNEDRWEQFKEAVTSFTEHEVPIVKKSSLTNYLKQCYKNDPQEATTGRNANSWFSSATMQSFAANAAWDEVYERLSCGWYPNSKGDLDPYITLDLIKLFFEDSEAAFAKAETQELPAQKAPQEFWENATI